MTLRVDPGGFTAGSLVLQESIPALSAGRHVVVTILSQPRQGLVLASLFGRHFLVETTIKLNKGDVLHLRVDATSPKVILKPAHTGAGVQQSGSDLVQSIEQLIGTFPAKPPQAFDLREILTRIAPGSSDDSVGSRVIHAMLDQIAQDPQAIAHLFIPMVDDESRGQARVSVARQGQGYCLHFYMETDFLGPLECLVRFDEGIDAEIRSGFPDIAVLLREHIEELKEHLGRFGVRRIEIVCRNPDLTSWVKGVDVVV